MTITPATRTYFRSILWIFALMLLANPAGAQVINEFVIGHTGTDRHEYMELSGAPGQSYANLSFVILDGSVNPGQVLYVVTAGTTDANGIWWSGYLGTSVIETSDRSTSILLVDGFTGATGNDLDSNNDGTLDSRPWASLLDDVAVNNQHSGIPAVNNLYSATVLREFDPAWDNQSYGPGGASRVPNATDTNAVSDWVRNDW